MKRPDALLPSAKPSPQELMEAIRRIEKFSPAPAILARAMVLMRDDQCDVPAIATLIRGDPALAADIIRISNTVFFGTHLPSQTVEEALQTIGFREAVRLLNLAVARIATCRNLDYYCISADDFWAESLFNGLFMERLASLTGGADPGVAYTCGLLRYIGRLAINQGIHDTGGGRFWLGQEPLSQWELANVGFTHSQAGAQLLRQWKFPAEMVVACSGQEWPARVTPPSWLAQALFFVSSVLPQEFDQPFHPVLAPISDTDFLHPNALTPAAVEAAFAETCTRYRELRRSFD